MGSEESWSGVSRSGEIWVVRELVRERKLVRASGVSWSGGVWAVRRVG